MNLSLPAILNLDAQFSILHLLGQAEDATDISIDFTHLERVSPAVLVTLVATVNRWKREGRRVDFAGLDHCSITGYLQRMDVLSACGIDRPEPFARHNQKGRLMPVREINHRTETLGDEMASCVAPGGEDYDHPMAGLYDLVSYVLTETANNTYQHSQGKGYAAAQVSHYPGIVRIAVADNGRGIRRSFVDAGFSWSAALDDVTAINKALEPRVSSKGKPANEGVGLTLVSQVAKLMHGWLLIVSGGGKFQMDPDGQVLSEALPKGCVYPGTLLALTFHRNKPHDWAALLQTAKQETGLLRNLPPRGIFE